MEMMKTCCSEVDLNVEILPNRNSWMIFFSSYFIYNFEEKKKIKQRKTKEIVQLCSNIMKSLELFIFVLQLKK